MANKLIIACAGAGKTETIVNSVLDRIDNEEKVLILTYTDNNQHEIVDRFIDKRKHKPQSVTVKGWFSFLLDDLIRPYQQVIFPNRIENINFNKNGNPHKNGNYTIPNRGEKINGNYNPDHFLTLDHKKAHTSFLSKLAIRINDQTATRTRINRRFYKIGKAIRRLSKIYDAIYIDEVQDLVGWDYELLKLLSVVDQISLCCVGDFRQTVYRTASGTKTPKTNAEKTTSFNQLTFEPEVMAGSYRCVQQICTFSDLIHVRQGYTQTTSLVANVPNAYQGHLGIFQVNNANVNEYIETYDPVIIRLNKNTRNDLCEGRTYFNFRKSKGLGFKRVLILPTEKQNQFIVGALNAFDRDNSDEPRNTFYVAVTRARYSLAFLSDDEEVHDQIEKWAPLQLQNT